MKRREHAGTESPDHQLNVVVQQDTNNQSLI